MNWKNRLTNYNFWISLVSAILLICQAFKFEFDIAYINEIVTAVLGLLVVIGIISDPTKIATKKEEKKTEKEENNQESNLNKEGLNFDAVPTDKKAENDINSSENDFKNLMTKISKDIENNINNPENLKTDLFELVSSTLNDIEAQTKIKTKEENLMEENLVENVDNLQNVVENFLDKETTESINVDNAEVVDVLDIDNGNVDNVEVGVEQIENALDDNLNAQEEIVAEKEDDSIIDVTMKEVEIEIPMEIDGLVDEPIEVLEKEKTEEVDKEIKEEISNNDINEINEENSIHFNIVNN